MAEPNYRFQKQQRDLKKVKRQEEKLRKKRARNEPTPTPAASEESSK